LSSLEPAIGIKYFYFSQIMLHQQIHQLWQFSVLLLVQRLIKFSIQIINLTSLLCNQKMLSEIKPQLKGQEYVLHGWAAINWSSGGMMISRVKTKENTTPEPFRPP
jgi:hypothetical protein